MQKYFKQAYDEIIDLHIQIESLFHNNKIIEGDRLPFLSYFHPNFTMITPNGLLRDFTWFSNWYHNAAGSRPDVKINIVNFKENFSCPDNVIVTYEEHQQVPNIKSLKRSSTAVFVPTNNPKQPLLWRHLHETWVR